MIPLLESEKDNWRQVNLGSRTGDGCLDKC